MSYLQKILSKNKEIKEKFVKKNLKNDIRIRFWKAHPTYWNWIWPTYILQVLQLRKKVKNIYMNVTV